MEAFTFARSSTIDYTVKVKICTLEGRYSPPAYSELIEKPELRFIGANTGPNSDLAVQVQVWAQSKPLALPTHTAYKSLRAGRKWDEWLEIPVKISQLPQGSQLAITIWDVAPKGAPNEQNGLVPFGGTTIPLFDEDEILRQGRQQCRIHRHKVGDGLSSTTTPWRPRVQRRHTPRRTEQGSVISPEEQELERLEALLKKHEAGELEKVDWMDDMVFKIIEQKRKDVQSKSYTSAQARRRAAMKHAKKQDPSKEQDRNLSSHADASDEQQSDEDDRDRLDGRFRLFIDLPRFDFPIVYTDHEYEPTPISQIAAQQASTGNVNLRPPPQVQIGADINGTGSTLLENDEDGNPIIQIYDPEIGAKDNPVEVKHRRLIRSQRTGMLDKDLKPNAKIRDDLNAILSYGPSQDLTVGEKDVIWRYRHHLTRDKRALTKFVKSVSWLDPAEARQAIQLLPKWTNVDVDDALELLGPSFDNVAVRAYAVDRLRRADDDELLLYLLQLVQALKFDKDVSKLATSDAHTSTLADFLISRATQSMILGNYFHWYLMVECDDRSPEQSADTRKLFAKVEFDFMSALMSTSEGTERRRTLLRQAESIAVLSKVSKEVRFSRDDRPRRIANLKKYLADPKNDLVNIDPPLPLPLDPNVLVTGLYPEESNVFKSSLFPLLITFRTTSGDKYPVIFKTGDDLRQDQLVIQIISLMDQLLRKENLDLRLTPYRILATSANAGAVQFVPSISLAAATAKNKGSILAYLRDHNSDPSADLGVRKDAMDTYIKSCAGYCVITYLLGVGDRHLDNLLLATDGHFFHADFGYILGRDPKPFAPQMKLCREMVEGMGGSGSKQYRDFKSYCFTAYMALRKSSNLILNLFALMVDANITDIRLMNREGQARSGGGGGGGGAAAASFVVEKVKERFHLEMSDEEAIRHFEGLIADSVGAIFPVVIDTIHNMMQGLRA